MEPHESNHDGRSIILPLQILSSGGEAPARARFRSLRKSAAIEEDFDAPRDTDVPTTSQAGLPRLLLPPDAPSPSLAPLTVDNNLLVVPSPAGSGSYFSPASSRQPSTELPANDLLAMSLNQNMLSFLNQQNGLAMLGQLAQDRKMDSGETDDSGLSPNNSFDASLKQELSFQQSGDVPPKSLIQEDVRNAGGRFQLVRKRGRSEVWNLFGQVVDSLTGQRLPYVACYACKVLYTDTGGGTGNMTRHRCPLGSSFRSLAGSSTDTMIQSSFDSVISNRRRSASPDLEKPSTSQHIIPNTKVLWQSGPDDTPSPTTGSRSKEAPIEAAIRWCATALVHPSILATPGFQAVVHAYSKARGADGDVPDVETLTQNIEYMVRDSRMEMKKEMLEYPERDPLILSVEKLESDGGRWVVRWHRLGTNFSLRISVVAVYRQNLADCEVSAVQRMLGEYGVAETRSIRLTAPCGQRVPPEWTHHVDVKHMIKQVVLEVLRPSDEPVLKQLAVLTDQCSSLELLPFYSDDWCELEEVTKLYRMASGWISHMETVKVALANTGQASLLAIVNNTVDWRTVRDVADFLEPFHDATESLISSTPNMHKALPEWMALIHACQDGNPSEALKKHRKEAEEKLREYASVCVTVEHRMACLLNPRLHRKLHMLLSVEQRAGTCAHVRALCGIPEPAPDGNGGNTSEPTCKRRRFLAELEGVPAQDELDSYLSTQFDASSTEDVLEFWCLEKKSFPSLAALARSLLAVPATAPRSPLHSTNNLKGKMVEHLLFLKTVFEPV